MDSSSEKAIFGKRKNAVRKRLNKRWAFNDLVKIFP